MANKDDYLTEYRQFFEHFAQTVNPHDQLPVKLSSYKLANVEVVGGIIDWTSQYLSQKQCPQCLVAPLVKIVIDEIRKACKKHPLACGFNPQDNAYEPLKLMQTVMAKTNEICLRYMDNSMLYSLPSPGPPHNAVSTCAVKNTRRRMEDRHTVVHDLNTMFNIQEASPSSYYAIFDGHAGHDAAAYSSAHLHQFLAESKHFVHNPEQALVDAFCKTDALFVDKCHVEKLSSGTTAVCALLRPKEKSLYIAWVGDSQALLASQGRVLQCVVPHKPCRDDERRRIEEQGGVVLYWGTWRVNGQLAVSRAIGDFEYKPYVIATPDTREIALTGSEDFIILACDGLWDFLTEDEAACTVYDMVCTNPDDTESISQRLAQLSKDQGSSDNISVIVVFLREPSKIAAEAHWPNRNTLTMDAGLDNANATNNPFANSNGTEILSQKDGFLLNLSDGFKQNGSEISPSNDYLFERSTNGKRSADEFDEDDDMGPETDVDAVDDISLSPSTEHTTNPLTDNKHADAFDPFATDMDEKAMELELNIQKQQTSEYDPTRSPREETPTPPADEVHDVALEENVADSGEESEDEWNYYKGDAAGKEQISSSKADQEVAEITKTKEEEEEDPDNMSQLNPDAAEFVPVASPTRVSPACRALINDTVFAQSPSREPPSDIDISLPNPLDFENEVKSRPSDVYSNGHESDSAHKLSSQEVMENLLNGKNIEDIEFHPSTPGKGPNPDEFHFGPNATPFSTPAKLLDQSETALSTKATFGDESSASYLDGKNLGFESSFSELGSSNPFGAAQDSAQPPNKEQDPMSMSFYLDKNDESNPFDLNKVQILPENLDDFLEKPCENGSFNETISDLPDHSPLEQTEPAALTTDLDKPSEGDHESEELVPGICKLPRTPEPEILISTKPLDDQIEQSNVDVVCESFVPDTSEPTEGSLIESPLPSEEICSEKYADDLGENLSEDVCQITSPKVPEFICIMEAKSSDTLSEAHSDLVSPVPCGDVGNLPADALIEHVDDFDQELKSEVSENLCQMTSKSPIGTTPEPIDDAIFSKTPDPTEDLMRENSAFSPDQDIESTNEITKSPYVQTPEPTEQPSPLVSDLVTAQSPEPLDDPMETTADVCDFSNKLSYTVTPEPTQDTCRLSPGVTSELIGDFCGLTSKLPDSTEDLQKHELPTLITPEPKEDLCALSPSLITPEPNEDLSALSPAVLSPEPKEDLRALSPAAVSPEPKEDLKASSPAVLSPEPKEDLRPLSPAVLSPEPKEDLRALSPAALSPEPTEDIRALSPTALSPEPKEDLRASSPTVLSPEPKDSRCFSPTTISPELRSSPIAISPELSPAPTPEPKDLSVLSSALSPEPTDSNVVSPAVLSPELEDLNTLSPAATTPEVQDNVCQIQTKSPEPDLAIAADSDLCAFVAKSPISATPEPAEATEELLDMRPVSFDPTTHEFDATLTNPAEIIDKINVDVLEFTSSEQQPVHHFEDKIQSEDVDDVTSSVKDDLSSTVDIIEEVKNVVKDNEETKDRDVKVIEEVETVAHGEDIEETKETTTEKELIKEIEEKQIVENQPHLETTQLNYAQELSNAMQETITGDAVSTLLTDDKDVEQTPCLTSSPKSVTSEQVDTESVATAEINSFLDRSNIPDVTSPLSPNEQQIDEQILLVDMNPLSTCVYPTDSHFVSDFPVQSEVKTAEYPEETVVSSSEDIKVERSATPIEPKEAPAALPEVEADKEKSDIPVVAAVTAAVVTVGAAAAVAATIDKDKKTLKSAKATPITKKPTKTATSPTKPSPHLKVPSKPAATKLSVGSPLKPPTTRTSKTPTSSKLTPSPAAKPPAIKMSLRPRPEPITKSAEKKQPVMNGDAKVGDTKVVEPKVTATRISNTKKTPTTSTVGKTSTKVSSEPKPATSARPATAAPKLSLPRTTAAPKPRPTTLATKSTTSTSTTSSVRAASVSATKTTAQTKTTTASSPKAATAKPRPATAPISRPKAPVPKTLSKGPDTEKQIKESANKQLTATRTITKTASSTATSTRTTTLRKVEVKAPATRTITSKTTVTSIKSTKKPTESARALPSKTAKPAPTKTTKPQQNGLSNGVTTVVQETTTIISTEPQLVKDLSPVENKLILDNSHFPETNIAD